MLVPTQLVAARPPAVMDPAFGVKTSHRPDTVSIPEMPALLTNVDPATTTASPVPFETIGASSVTAPVARRATDPPAAIPSWPCTMPTVIGPPAFTSSAPDKVVAIVPIALVAVFSRADLPPKKRFATASEPAVCVIPPMPLRFRTSTLGTRSAVRKIVRSLKISSAPALIMASSVAESSSVLAAVFPVDPRLTSKREVNGAIDTRPEVTIVPPMAIRSPVRAI